MNTLIALTLLSTTAQNPAVITRYLRPAIFFVDGGYGMGESLVDSFGCDVVAVGRVGKVLKRAFESSASHPWQHTTFEFYVEGYIKADQSILAPILRVRQELGILPWRDGESAGIGSYIAWEPMLIQRRRYVLFLYRNLNREREQRQTVERAGRADSNLIEFNVAMGGQFFIEQGRFVEPQVQWAKYRQTRKFYEGPQLLGLNEREGLVLLYEACRRWQILDAQLAEKRRKLGEDALKRIREGKANPPKKKDPPSI